MKVYPKGRAKRQQGEAKSKVERPGLLDFKKWTGRGR